MSVSSRSGRRLAAAASLAGALALGGCQDSGMVGGASTRSLTPIPPDTLALMQTRGMSQADPILVRAYKKEAEMEVWKRGANGQYALLKTFPICRWSGQLGPKTKQGDRQAPEGFYTITPGQMNPNSAYYLSFDVGYPNAVDRAKGGSGNYIMVHGTCSSAGCFAMTDASMSELYAIARESFAGGQRAFQFQSYPFRMTAANVAKFRNDPNAAFWRNLKEGSDYFEALHDEPRVGTCGSRYVFGGADAAAGSCTPRVDPLVAEKRDHDAREVAELVAKGTPALRVVYEDGGQNPVFRPQAPQTNFASLTESETEKQAAEAARVYARHNLGDVSRPESLAAGPREIEVDAKGRPVMMADAGAPGPTKAAAQALAHKGSGKEPGKAQKGTADPATLMAKVEPVAEPVEAKRPARITVADADGDPSAFSRVLGPLLRSSSPTPTTDATLAEPVVTAAAATNPAAATAKVAGRHVANGTTKTAAVKPGVRDPAKDTVKDSNMDASKPGRDGAKAAVGPKAPPPHRTSAALKPQTAAQAATN